MMPQTATTQDGRILNAPRAALNRDEDIIAFMAKDIAAIGLPEFGADWSALVDRGWTASQCRRCFHAALQRTQHDSLAGIGLNILALGLLLAAIAAISLHFSAGLPFSA